MAQKSKLRFCKGDWLAIGLVIVLAVVVLLCFLPTDSAPAAYAQIYVNGELVKTVALDQDQTFVIENLYCNQIAVSDGAIFITESTCPGKDCVHSGSIHQTGRSLVCLPNRMEIRVVSESSDVDFVVG